MAPELLMRQPYDFKVDIFALGVTMGELLMGMYKNGGFYELWRATKQLQRLSENQFNYIKPFYARVSTLELCVSYHLSSLLLFLLLFTLYLSFSLFYFLSYYLIRVIKSLKEKIRSFNE